MSKAAEEFSKLKHTDDPLGDIYCALLDAQMIVTKAAMCRGESKLDILCSLAFYRARVC